MSASLSTAEKIRKLLKEGKLEVKQIAEKLDVKPAYVYQIRYKDAQLKAERKAAKGNGNGNTHHEDEVITSLPEIIPPDPSVIYQDLALDAAIAKTELVLADLKRAKEQLKNLAPILKILDGSHGVNAELTY